MKKSTKTFVLSDETPNLYDFITDNAGLDLTDFILNPVMLYNHDYTKVIGQWTDVRKEGVKLLGVPMFDEDDAEAMKYYSKVEQGILRGASIGITPIQFDEAAKRMVKSSLKETSLTPVPANRKAITLYDNNGQMLSAIDAQQFLLSLHDAGSNIGNVKNRLNIPVTDMRTYDDLALNAPDELALIMQNDPARFDRLVSEKVKTVRLSGMLGNEPDFSLCNNGMESSDEFDTYDDFALNAPDELASMQKSNPTRFNKLLSEKIEAVQLSGITGDGCRGGGFGNIGEVDCTIRQG